MHQKNQLSSEYTLKQYFDTLLNAISGLELPTYLTNFQEFKLLEVNFLIRALYDVANNPRELIVLQNIYNLIAQLLLFKNKAITFTSHQYILRLKEAIRLLTGYQHTAIDVFMKEASEFLFFRNSSEKKMNPDKIMAEVKQIFQIIQRASDLYYKNHLPKEKESLKTYLASISPYLLKNIARLLKTTIGNLDSEDYFQCLTFIQASLDKTFLVKGLKMLLGEKFLVEIQKHQQCFLCMQEADQFLAYDFSKPIKRNQEDKILAWLRVFSEMDLDFLEIRFTYAFSYYAQINCILSHNQYSDSFEKKVITYYQVFKKNISNYLEKVNLKSKRSDSNLLSTFSLMLLDIEEYYKVEEGITLDLEVNIKYICAHSDLNLYKYFYLYIEFLNYIPFLSNTRLTISMEKIKNLSLSLRTIYFKEKTKGNDCLKYLIKNTGEKFLEYFVKNIMTPVHSSIHFQTDKSIEELSLLNEKTKNTLLYLIEVENFYHAFFALIENLCPNIHSNSKIKKFTDDLFCRKNCIKEALGEIEKILQEKLNFLTEKTIPIIVSHFKAIDEALEVIEKTLKKIELNLLIKATIPVIIVYFRLNVLGYFQTIAENYVKNYSYKAKLKGLCSALMENFSEMELTSPTDWANLLQTLFADEKTVSYHRAFMFIVGFFYEEKESYQTAREFYAYCLKYALFEISTKSNEGVCLVTQALIENHIHVCEEKLNTNVSKLSESSPLSQIPSVFQNATVRKPLAGSEPVNAHSKIPPTWLRF